jgi:ferredoxin
VPVIVIDNLAREIPALPGQSLLVSLLHEGQPIHTRCGGRARCGCCRVRIEPGGKGVSPRRPEEEALLGAERSAAGWRLACQTYLLRDVTLSLPSAAELEAKCSSTRSGTTPKGSSREKEILEASGIL